MPTPNPSAFAIDAVSGQTGDPYDNVILSSFREWKLSIDFGSTHLVFRNGDGSGVTPAFQVPHDGASYTVVISMPAGLYSVPDPPAGSFTPVYFQLLVYENPPTDTFAYVWQGQYNVFPGSGGGGGTPPATATSSASLALDAHRRPLVAGGASGVSLFYSDDAGHSFTAASVGAGKDPSLLVDTRRNAYRVIYDNGGLIAAYGLLGDGLTPGGGSPAAITGLTGHYPVAAAHPADRDYFLMTYLDGTTLKAAMSLDAGATWAYLATVDSGLDFTNTGRAALCWLGEKAFIVYGSGNNLFARTSNDRGATWGAAVTVATTGPYSGLSMLGWQGRLYLLAWTVVSSALTPALRISPDLAATWTASVGTLPTLTPPTAIGIIPQSGQIRLGITHNSDNDGATWATD